MFRGLIKTGAACALHSTGADKLLGALTGQKNAPMIIGYHRVVENFDASSEKTISGLLISRRMFERHLDWLGRRFRFLSLDELGAQLESGRAFEKPAVALMFDDGYRDVYDHAFPLLLRKGIPASVFVVSDLVDTGRVLLHDKLYLLLKRAFSGASALPLQLGPFWRMLGIRSSEMERKRGAAFGAYLATRAVLQTFPQEGVQCVVDALEHEVAIDDRSWEGFRLLSWDMLVTMQQAGIVIGSHTKSHRVLTNESRPAVREEVEGSRLDLERKLGRPVKHFAYPDGRFNSSTIQAVAASGYRYGYTICEHQTPLHPLLTIPRVMFWENTCLDLLGRFSPAVMSCQVQGIFSRRADCQLDHA